MKKILTALLIFAAFAANALTLTVVGQSFEEYVDIEKGSEQYFDITAKGTYTSSDFITITIYHFDISDGSLHDELVLLNERYYSYYLPLPQSYVNGSRRVKFIMPSNYRDGRFKIVLSHNTQRIMGGFIKDKVTSVKQLVNNESIKTFYDLHGRIIDEPLEGFYIIQEGDTRKKVYKTCN